MRRHQDRAPYGHRLIPHIIDEYASNEPQRIYAVLVKSSNIHSAPEEITFGQLANAINACALWLQAHIGRPESVKTIAYLARSDLLTSILILAAIKADLIVG